MWNSSPKSIRYIRSIRIDDNNDMNRKFDISVEIYNTEGDDCTQERNTTNRLSDIAIVKY